MLRVLRAAVAAVSLGALAAVTGCGFLVPDFSPDGKSAAIAGGKALRILDLETGVSRDIGPKAWVASFSPDGSTLVYQSDPAGSTGGSGAVMAYSVSTGRARPLPGAPPGPWAWREDGKRIVGMQDPGDGKWQAVWYNVTDPGVVLRVSLPGKQCAPPVWLPDTDDIACLLEHGSGGQPGDAPADVYLVESGEVRRVTNTHDVIGLGLSADGKKVTWVRRGPNLRYILLSIYAYDLGSRSVARLPFPERVPPLNPDARTAPSLLLMASFSPDGRRLAVVANEGGAQPAGPQGARGTPQPKPRARTVACYVMGIDGTGARLLRRLASREVDPAVMWPFWSRDGARIAVSDLDAGDNATLWLYNADGTGGKRIGGP